MIQNKTIKQRVFQLIRPLFLVDVFFQVDLAATLVQNAYLLDAMSSLCVVQNVFRFGLCHQRRRFVMVHSIVVNVSFVSHQSWYNYFCFQDNKHGAPHSPVVLQQQCETSHILLLLGVFVCYVLVDFNKPTRPIRHNSMTFQAASCHALSKAFL